MDTALYEKIFEIEEHYWWSVGTRAIFRDWLKQAQVQSSRPLHYLDVGCGSGIFAHELSGLGRVTGIDCSAQAVSLSRRRGLDRLCVAHAEQLPFAKESFDAVAALDVIEHADDVTTLREIARVLKPGGIALVHVPAFPLLWGEHDEAAHHRRRYRRASFHEAIEASGLSIERLSYINFLLFLPTLSVRLAKRALRGVRAPSTARAEIYDLPAWANTTLTAVLQCERALLRRANLPFGVSLLCLARRNRS